MPISDKFLADWCSNKEKSVSPVFPGLPWSGGGGGGGSGLSLNSAFVQENVAKHDVALSSGNFGAPAGRVASFRVSGCSGWLLFDQHGTSSIQRTWLHFG